MLGLEFQVKDLRHFIVPDEFLLCINYDLKIKQNACLINSQSLTACQKCTRQVIKISRHNFLEKGVKKTQQCSSCPPAQIRLEMNVISEPWYFGKQGTFFLDTSVLLENTPLIKFIQNYIKDSSDIFSTSSLVKILMISLILSLSLKLYLRRLERAFCCMCTQSTHTITNMHTSENIAMVHIQIDVVAGLCKCERLNSPQTTLVTFLVTYKTIELKISLFHRWYIQIESRWFSTHGNLIE